MLGYSVRALKDPDGADGALVVFQDLTEVKKLERQARFNEQLAAVGELAAGIAHEIRNPLASISGSVQVLAHDLSVGSAERRLMEIIVSESNRLSKILEEFLRFVRPQERRVALFDVAGNIQEVLDLFRLSDEVSDAHAIVADVAPRLLAALGRPRPDPPDHLQRRQERRARDARRRDAHGRGPRGRGLV